jgi:hypothetical protein
LIFSFFYKQSLDPQEFRENLERFPQTSVVAGEIDWEEFCSNLTAFQNLGKKFSDGLRHLEDNITFAQPGGAVSKTTSATKFLLKGLSTEEIMIVVRMVFFKNILSKYQSCDPIEFAVVNGLKVSKYMTKVLILPTL